MDTPGSLNLSIECLQKHPVEIIGNVHGLISSFRNWCRKLFTLVYDGLAWCCVNNGSGFVLAVLGFFLLLIYGCMQKCIKSEMNVILWVSTRIFQGPPSFSTRVNRLAVFCYSLNTYFKMMNICRFGSQTEWEIAAVRTWVKRLEEERTGKEERGEGGVRAETYWPKTSSMKRGDGLAMPHLIATTVLIRPLRFSLTASSVPVHQFFVLGG